MFHSLDDYKKKESPSDKDKRKTTDSYTGGKSSGIAVENPDDWMEKARKKESNSKEGFEKTKNKLTLKVYKNGFILDDSPFRDISKPENKKFMDEVEKGYIPNELVKKGITDLGIALEDHRNENYEEPIPEKKFEAFSGKGQSLGSINTQGLKVDKNAVFQIDKSKPTCKVNIRLFNGETVCEEFNLCNTVRDIMRFVENVSGSHNFTLLDGFPPRPIVQVDKTIEELKLQGSMLTQRIN